MSALTDTIKRGLSRSQEIHITVKGRKSGRTVSIPIWFVFEDEKVYLLPVSGSDTHWYKNVLKNPAIRIKAGGAEAKCNAVVFTDSAQVSSVIEKFRGKYGDSGVKLYRKLDVAVLAQTR